ncbi:MAG TPA: hypothetical protein VKE94_20335, partial [Gemmataceae bacterium]|nr:hypothetical protein [Gemmataceae bacterium]
RLYKSRKVIPRKYGGGKTRYKDSYWLAESLRIGESLRAFDVKSQRQAPRRTRELNLVAVSRSVQ